MGGGRSPASKGGGGAKMANTPSGVDYQQFMNMSLAQKFATMQSIIDNRSITVPAHLDDSVTSKVLYGLGIDSKPQVVDDATFDTMKANGDLQFNYDMFRTVNDGNGLTASNILNQTARGDFTRMSGNGSSAYGRGLYFAGGAQGLAESMDYGWRGRGATTMRANINKKAKVVSESKLENSAEFSAAQNMSVRSADHYALAALAAGYDGWKHDFGSYHYTVMVNRENMVVSSTAKKVPARYNRSTQWSSFSKSRTTQTQI